ncbi:MAG: hypothetical protein J0L55_16745 [Caulobacterales bacterium]|nr:hypothetical protein [Caulobacterales bacterium]
MSKRVLALILGLLFAALVTAAAFIASTYEDSARAGDLINFDESKNKPHN